MEKLEQIEKLIIDHFPLIIFSLSIFWIGLVFIGWLNS